MDKKKITVRFYMQNEEDKKAYDYLSGLDKSISKQQAVIRAINKMAETEIKNEEISLADIIANKVSTNIINALGDSITINKQENNSKNESNQEDAENDLLDFDFL